MSTSKFLGLGTNRSGHGGSLNGGADYCRVDSRGYCKPGIQNQYYGFRVIRR